MTKGGVPFQRHHAEHPAQGGPFFEELLPACALSARNAVERMFCRLKDFRRIASSMAAVRSERRTAPRAWSAQTR